jgi:phosphopantetheine adenylyltransferase
VKQQEADGRTIFGKSFDFYLDCVNKSDHKKILADIDEKIQGLKREIEDATKIEVESVKQFEDFISSPDRHFK